MADDDNTGLSFHSRMLSRSQANALIQKTDAICRRVRLRWYRFLGMQLEGDVHLRRIRVPRNFHDIRIQGGGTYLDDFVVLIVSGEPHGRPKISIGRNCGFNRFTLIDASEEIVFDDGARIGPGCYITDHDHGTAPDQPITAQPLRSAPTRIGKDTWLGAGVKVMKGVTIGDGAIVGAGSVVTRNIAPGMIAAGVPAKVIRPRG